MLRLLKSRWKLLIGLILFTIARLPVLRYPFYWDEAWSYAPGIKLMYLHGPSLMPNAIDVFYSRGHPLLFYAAVAGWMKIFGESHTAQHAFSLLISLCTITAAYEVSLRLFNKRIALFTLILLPLHVMFYVQSTFLLPEIMVALFSLVTIYFYVTGRSILTFICCTALMLTKESGMVMGLVLGIHSLYSLANKEEDFKNRLANFLALSAAGVAIGFYFLLQKKLNGWYFYPEHTGYIQLDTKLTWTKLIYALDIVFNHDYHLFHLLLLLAIVVAVHLRDIRYAVPVLPGYLMYVTIEDKFSWLPRKFLFAILLASLAFTTYQYVQLSGIVSKVRTKFIYLSVLFICAYLAFTCINFFTSRYLICFLVFVLILAAAWFDLYITMLYRTIYYLTLACMLLSCYYCFKYDIGVGDVNLGAFDGIVVEENMVRYFENAHLYDKNIATVSFQIKEILQKPYAGFLHSDSTFKNISYDTSQTTDYVATDNIRSDVHADSRYDSLAKSPEYHLVYKFEKGRSWAMVFEKVK